MERFYRFELAFDGELQDVGLLQGLDDVGLPEDVTKCLLAPFDEDLAAHQVDEHVAWWFTAEGLRKFAPAVDRIIETIADYGWQVYGGIMEDDRSEALAYDVHQAGFSPEREETDRTAFQELSAAADILKITKLS